MGLKPGQQKCVDTLDKPLIVAAGAGSGKTFTLTQRIANAFSSGYVDDIDQILAITYTRKAAGELKSRIRAELRARGFHDQAMKVNDAWISTIHGMCLRILKTHAFELGLDPRMQLLSGAQSAQMMAEALDYAIDNASTIVDASKAKALFAEYSARTTGFGSASIESLLKDLLQKADQDPEFFQKVCVVDSSTTRIQAIAKLDELNRAYLDRASAQKQGASQSKAVSDCTDALGVLDEATASSVDQLSTRSFLELVDRFPKPAANFGGKEFKEEAKALRAEMQQIALEACLAEAKQHLETLLALAEAAYTHYDQAKRSRFGLTNGDLLNLAAKALDDERISALYSDKFKLVMVDEFQDTNQMQVDMIARLAGANGERLCVVGDAQQSIYRFQGADVSVFKNHRSCLFETDPDSVIVLSDNFRSHRDILSFVDRVFEQNEGFGADFMSLAPGRTESGEPTEFDRSPRIEVQLAVDLPRASKGEPAKEAAETCEQLQARMIAERFAQMRRDGSRASDMVVLLGRTANAEVYADALRKEGFASVVAKGSIFNSSAEAQAMVALANYLANPLDDEALRAILLSDLVTVTADDLVWLATGEDEQGRPCRRNLAKGMIQTWSPDFQDELTPTLACASSCLRRAASTATRQSMSSAMAQVLLEGGALERLELAGAEGRAKAGNLYKAIRLMESVEQDMATGPRSCASWFAAEMEAASESPGALSASAGDFVKIMTIHSSKGLEFPIVAVSDFENTAVFSALALYEGPGGAVASLDLSNSKHDFSGVLKDCSKAVELETDDEEELKAIVEAAQESSVARVAIQKLDDVASQAERVRLLYVALTRARETLIVSSKATPTKDSLFGNPKPCAMLVRDALTHGEPWEDGASYSFGGTSAAAFTCRHVAEASEPNAEPQESTSRGPVKLQVPAPYDSLPARSHPLKAAQSGIDSYSSLSHQAESKGLGLSCRFEVIGSPVRNAACEQSPDADAFGTDASARKAVRWSEDENGDLCSEQRLVEDDDKATDLGTAFHRLAQVATMQAGPGANLAKPDAARIDAMARKTHLSPASRERLDRALDGWFGSQLCSRTAGFDAREAEAPFIMPLDGEGTRFLEGEIDLLCTTGTKALIVDYKTGGNASEGAETLRKKHLLQASCYASCLFKMGFDQVEAVFVRVEQLCADGEPQQVVYRFDSSDASQFEIGLSSAAAAAEASAIAAEDVAAE